MLPFDEHHFFRDIWDQFHEADISYGLLKSNPYFSDAKYELFMTKIRRTTFDETSPRFIYVTDEEKK